MQRLDALRDAANRKGEPDVVPGEQLGGANIVCDERSNDAECTARFGAPCGSRRHKLGCEGNVSGIPHGKTGSSLPIPSNMNVNVRKKNRAIMLMLVLREAILEKNHQS